MASTSTSSLRLQIARDGPQGERGRQATYEEVHRALLTGLLVNIGFKDEGREYQGARNSRFFIHPSSGLFDKSPKWIVAAERVETTRQYGRIVARVQPGWIEDAGPHLVQRSYSEPHWQAQIRARSRPIERVTLFGRDPGAQAAGQLRPHQPGGGPRGLPPLRPWSGGTSRPAPPSGATTGS